MTFQLIIGDQVITSLDTDCNYRQYLVALKTLTNIIELKRKEYQTEIDRQNQLLMEECGY